MTTAEQVGTAQPAMFRPRRLGHANLWVGDIQKTTEFYNKVFGLTIEATEPGLLASFLGNGNTHHDIGMVEITRGKDRIGRDGEVLLPKTEGTRVGLFHLGWEMENEAELVSAIKRAQAADESIAMIVDHQISHSIYMPDPDGNLMEFYADIMKDWHGWFHGEMELITGHWDPSDVIPANDPRYDLDPRLYGVDEAPLHPLRITHTAIVVDEVDRSCAFYNDIAGLATAHKAADGSYACLQGTAGGYDLGLLAANNGTKASVHHIGFQLASEAAVEQSAGALGQAGITIEKQIDDATKRSLFVVDPDGMRVEFFCDRNPDPTVIGKAAPELRPYLA